MIVSRHSTLLILAVAVVLSMTAGVGADDGSNAKSAEAGTDETDDVEVLEASRARVEEIVMYRGGDARTVVPHVAEPVLRFGDLTRANKHGSLWMWGQSGRPQAVLELYRNLAGDWVYVFNWLSGSELTAERDGGLWWTPAAPTVQFDELEGARPAGSEALRTTQMRAIARRFSAHEFWDPNNSRFELRLLATPLHRYTDPDRGIIDGAVLAYANGTNPEVVLLLEAHAVAGERRWQYGFARLGHAEMHVELDDAEVWTVPRVDPSRRDEPYWLFYEPTVPGSE